MKPERGSTGRFPSDYQTSCELELKDGWIEDSDITMNGVAETEDTEVNTRRNGMMRDASRGMRHPLGVSKNELKSAPTVRSEGEQFNGVDGATLTRRLSHNRRSVSGFYFM
jgi:hypothetical protein